MLSSAEHEICPANKSQITNNSIFFLLKIAEYENFCANTCIYENASYCYLLAEKILCSAELSMEKDL